MPSRRIPCSPSYDPCRLVAFPWYALHVRSNQEFLIRRALIGQDLEQFLPSYEVTRGKQTFERPLFPGYLFARFDAVHRLPILKISGVLTVLGDTAGPIAIADLEVENIRHLAAAPSVTPHASRVNHGQKVRIKYGSLIGQEGIVDYQRGACRVVVDVPMFGRAVSVQVERDAIEIL